MSTHESPLKPDFRNRAKTNDVPVARLIGFEAKQVAGGRATVTLAAGPQHANPMGTLHGGILYNGRIEDQFFPACLESFSEGRG